MRSRRRHVKEARFLLPDYHTRTFIRGNRARSFFDRQVQGDLLAYLHSFSIESYLRESRNVSRKYLTPRTELSSSHVPLLDEEYVQSPR